MFRTCCAHHANVDAQDEQMQMDEMQRVDWLIENGHVSYHPPPDSEFNSTSFISRIVSIVLFMVYSLSDSAQKRPLCYWT